MSNNKCVLFSPIGTTDPIRSQADGAMLHIVRHFRPEAVWLFLTKEMSEYHKKDDRYRKSIWKVMHECEIKVIETDIENPNDFDACFQKFREVLKLMRETYKDYEILVNISSGTPQMKNLLSYEAVAGNFGVTAIQVNSPNKRANDNEEHLTSNFDLELAFETNEDHNNPDQKPRWEKPNFKAITAFNLSFKIESMVKSYNYSGALNLLESKEDLFDERLLSILKHADLRSKLQYDQSAVLLNNDSLKCFKERLLCINDRNALKFYEFFMTMKVRQKREELSEMILKLTPFSFELALYYLRDVLKFDIGKIAKCIDNSRYILQRDLISIYDKNMLSFLDSKYNRNFKDCDLSLDNIVHILNYLNTNPEICNKFIVLREVESEIRNKTAHQMISVTEDSLTKLMENREKKMLINLPKNSSRIIDLCESLLKLIFGSKLKGVNFVYDEINVIVKELLI